MNLPAAVVCLCRHNSWAGALNCCFDCVTWLLQRNVTVKQGALAAQAQNSTQSRALISSRLNKHPQQQLRLSLRKHDNTGQKTHSRSKRM